MSFDEIIGIVIMVALGILVIAVILVGSRATAHNTSEERRRAAAEEWDNSHGY